MHEYYSVARFRAAYATPIPALTDQSQWPEVDFEFSMCPPLAKRKPGRPRVSRFKPWFEKGRSRRRGKRKMKNQNNLRKATKIDASCVRNLVTELDLPNAVTLQKSQSKFNFYSILLL